MNTLADNDGAQWLRAVSGAPLTILFGFAIASADLVTATFLRSVTTFSQDTLERHTPALVVLGLVEPVKRYTWRLTPRGQLAAAVVRNLLSSLTPQIAESLPERHQLPLPVTPQKAESTLEPGKAELPAPVEIDGITRPVKSDSAKSGVAALTTTTNIYSESDSHTVVVGDGDQLKNLVTALRAAHVYPNVCQRLAEELIAEDGPGWLRQTLGWIATLRGEKAQTRGATICEALKARARVPDESLLPPAGLPFRAALAWAQRVDQPDDERASRYDGYLHPELDEREAAHAAVESAVKSARKKNHA